MNIPDAATALEEACRPRKARSQPKAYMRAMTAVMGSISRAVSLGLKSTVVDVPTFVFGEPRFDVDDVTEHVRQDLVQRGYTVDTFPGVPSIAISWGQASRAQKTAERTGEGEEPCPEQYDVGL